LEAELDHGYLRRDARRLRSDDQFICGGSLDSAGTETPQLQEIVQGETEQKNANGRAGREHQQQREAQVHQR
jgi:hypothetical protein